MINHLGRFILIVYLLIFCAPAWSVAPKLESDTEVSTAGYFRLQWGTNGTTEFVLEESQQPSFTPSRVLYQGPDTARIISGRGNGDYYYRIRDVETRNGENVWSEVLHVQVKHHSLSRAFLFFSIGAIVFVVTLIVIIIGNRQVSKK